MGFSLYIALMRLTSTLVRVLRSLVDSADRERYGFELAQETGMYPASLYSVLRRLEEAGWVRSEWERVDTYRVGRPRRRYYRLTEVGLDGATSALSRRPA